MDEPVHTAALELANERLIWREVDDQVIVLDKRTWNYLSINDSGALLWRQIARGATHAELVARLRDDYELDEQAAARDVQAFISMMRKNGLLLDGSE
jgi:Coenzyme PQQ synthesis protein D (PqqD)